MINPKQLSNWPDDIEVEVGIDAVSRMSPKIAALGMQVISAWSYVQMEQVLAVTHMLKADYAVMASVFESLTGARRIALRAAAQKALSSEDFKLYEQVGNSLDTAARHRDRFAHWLWMYSPDIPDSLLLQDPSHFSNAEISYSQFRADLNKVGPFIVDMDADEIQSAMDRIKAPQPDPINRAETQVYSRELIKGQVP